MRLPRRALLAAIAATAACLAQPSPAASRPGLHVSGSRIVDGAGHTVVLRGINRAGTEGGGGASNVPVTDAEIGWSGSDHASSWHAGAVRVLLGSAQWTGGCKGLAAQPASYQRRIDAEVRWITSRHMVALLDLHTSTAGCTAVARHAMPDAPLAQQFWTSVARHYATNPLVAFELYNEPHWVTEAVWRNGTAKATFQDCDPQLPLPARLACQATSPRYQAVGMQELYDLVARAAPGHLIVVDGYDWATVPPARPLVGRPVYAVHPYTCPGPGACQSAAYAHANVGVLRRWLPLSRRAPIWVTEFGWPSKAPFRDVDGSGYYRETIRFLESQRPAWGWLAFAFDGSSSGAFTLTSDTSTYVPNSTGAPVFRGLHRFS
ncbi:MAG: glycoside hydrolase family 5 protein [Mycobacteriales bacterium]